MPPVTLNIGKEFSRTPGGRKEEAGLHSAEKFLREHLLPAYQQARSRGEPLHVELDGTYGYAITFLDEAFSGLVEALGEFPKLVLHSEEEPELVSEITGIVDQAFERVVEQQEKARQVAAGGCPGCAGMNPGVVSGWKILTKEEAEEMNKRPSKLGRTVSEGTLVHYQMACPSCEGTGRAKG